MSTGSPTELEHNVEVFMHDFAAYLLMELQQGMLNLSVGMMSLTTILDQPEIFGYDNITDQITKRHGTEDVPRIAKSAHVCVMAVCCSRKCG